MCVCVCVCVRVGGVFEVSSRQVLTSVVGVVFFGRGGGCAVMHAVGPPSAAYLR